MLNFLTSCIWPVTNASLPEPLPPELQQRLSKFKPQDVLSDEEFRSLVPKSEKSLVAVDDYIGENESWLKFLLSNRMRTSRSMRSSYTGPNTESTTESSIRSIDVQTEEMRHYLKRLSTTVFSEAGVIPKGKHVFLVQYFANSDEVTNRDGQHYIPLSALPNTSAAVKELLRVLVPSKHRSVVELHIIKTGMPIPAVATTTRFRHSRELVLEHGTSIIETGRKGYHLKEYDLRIIESTIYIGD